MVFKFENVDEKQYLVAMYEKERMMDRRSMRVLMHNEIPCILMPLVGKECGYTCLYYDMGWGQSLTERLTQPMSAQFALTILKSLCEMWKTEETFFLDEGGFAWDTDYMFVDSEGHVKSVYIPGYRQEGFMLLTREYVLGILSRIISTDQENWEELCRVYRWIEGTTEPREAWFDQYQYFKYMEEDMETEVLVGYDAGNTCELTGDMMPQFKTQKQRHRWTKKQMRKENRMMRRKMRGSTKRRNRETIYYPRPVLPSVQNVRNAM